MHPKTFRLSEQEPILHYFVVKNLFCKVCVHCCENAETYAGTYQAPQQEANKGHFSQDGGADYVAKAYSAHCHHKKIHTSPVADIVRIREIWWVSRVL